jgi:threonine dehydratase
MLSLNADQLAAGVVTASSGNHGLAVAHACKRLGTHAVVFVPQGPAKNLEEIEALDANVLCHGTDCVETEVHAREFSIAHGLTYIPPYNDRAVVAGQGSIASELLRQSRGLDIVYVAVGGGGLLAGIAAGLAAAWPNTEIVACSPAASPVMIESLAAGKVLDLPSEATWSDGTAGGLEEDTITFTLCQQLVTRSITVEEEAILDGVRVLREELGRTVEGAAGMAAAAMLADQGREAGARAGLVVCGGNVSQDLLESLQV